LKNATEEKVSFNLTTLKQTLGFSTIYNRLQTTSPAVTNKTTFVSYLPKK
jgi:hypothetical protein